MYICVYVYINMYKCTLETGPIRLSNVCANRLHRHSNLYAFSQVVLVFGT